MKIDENIQCEIFKVVLEQAKEGYPNEIVVELSSDTIDEMYSNVDRIVGWVDQYLKDKSL